MKSFGELIRTKREEQKMLLRHLSASLDMDMALLSKIERGDRFARIEQVEKIAEVLKIDLQELKSIWLADKIFDMANKEETGLEILDLAIKKVNKTIKNK
ncbi:transcriptional regulator, HTH_XRE superfamily [Psychroflexus torquis ATCC 700755]|jgi:transcriptional regulator with XRE-family HTH domain|uniref:Transcriptional regulator, HTH_XRE superfamily n=1 Tax=Psychroflexus torquis (strain ATCC 700755 / CIP 106069 / ACAM 623) TaxID=313595 RepID=K4IIM8_PSYTT|nr:helix-turn-helix transcriptional regulator [Psychroflexus torquis]AFU69673.1 transcriptional regulator, HTH_XRE superfamily [Psychroflexus torquis ATCC 700755]